MKATYANIKGIVILEPRVFYDERGFFFESYNEKTMSALGIDVTFVQEITLHRAEALSEAFTTR